jgi:methylated-DNA-[protein]-cysteine S-methyltransferase
MIYYYPIKLDSIKKTFLVAKNKDGICSISFSADEKKFVKSLELYLGDEVKKSKPKLTAELKQITDYFKGKRKSFNMRVFLRGTAFQTKVWLEIAKIPFGKTITYSELAKRVKSKNAVRAVGSACGKNPVPIVIPCHRVLAKNSIGGFGGGVGLKKKMLALEGTL